MKPSKLYAFLGILVALSMILAACTPTTAEPTQAPEVEEPEAVPAETEAPAEEPQAPATTRNGAWVDEVVFTSIDEVPNAVAQLQADALDVYGYMASDPDAFATIKSDPNLTYTMSYGSYDSILYNDNFGETVFADGRLNPFANRKVREATNYLVDRDYVVQEAVGGLGVPKWTVMIGAFPDYALYADVIRPIENKYAYNMEKADEIITAEMEAMGATKVDGKWNYNGEPVVLIGLIRSEDEREEIGNYFANQLEAIGFTVDRQVRTRTELAPIWQQSDPREGQWHWYTGGNYYPALVRNSSNFFAEHYTSLVAGTTAEEAFDPTPEFYQLCVDLYNNKYSSMEERREMFAEAIRLGVEDSSYMFIVAPTEYYPRKANTILSSDLGGGIPGSSFWPQTIRFEGQEGGTIRMASSGILTGPWNPQAGHNWAQELYIIRATQDASALSDPYTGLFWNQRVERAEVVAQEGTPIQKTLDWVDLTFEPEIQVPADAWADWDAKNQKFITVGEKYPEGTTAITKVTVYYPEDLYDIKWHDGSNLSISDFVFYMITTFEIGKTDSPIFDEAQQSTVEAFLAHFKGVKIISTDPLIIETYDDRPDLDAESLVGNYYTTSWFPVTNTGPQPWHTYTIAMMAEANQELAFSADKSTSLSVNWTNFIDGPSLEILKKYLDQAKGETYIPFAPTMSQFLTAEEAAARYTNLDNWYGEYGHFWVGSGPFYLEQVNSIEGSVVIKRNENYPDMADKWSRFGEPQVAVVDVTGPADVKQGTEAVFDVFISFNDQPYPQADIMKAVYMVYDGVGNMIFQGDAEFVEEGQYQVVLGADVTKDLPTGSTKVEVVVIPTVVSIPTFAPFQFVVSAP